MGRAPCCEKVGLKKGPWTPEEDQKLVAYVQEHGLGSWRALPKKAGLLRCGKSCRLRWTNYLRPDIKRGKFTLSEEQTIIQLHALLGNRWSAIASHLPKRTDNEIKNYWNTHLKKRLLKMGIDPATHKPKPDPSNLLDAKPQFSSTLSHMAQWESARLEAEARLARESLSRSHGVWSETKTFSKISSSAKSWDSNSSDFSSESDNGLPPILNCKQTGAVHFVNIDRNWENSLQGQADIMWSGSLAMSRVSAAGMISSSCSTAHGEQMELGSPTSTLCSFEAPCGNAIPSVTGAKAGCYPTTGLSWPDEILPDIRVVDLGKGRGGRSSDSKNLQPDKICWQWDEALRSPRKGEGAMEQGVHSSFPCLHEAALVEEDGCCPCPPSMLWSQSMESPNVDLSRIELEGVPALASACTSSNLGGDLEHISQDITSSNNFCFSTSCNEISPEMLMNLGADKSKSHADVGYGLTTHIVYDTVLPDYKVEEENSEYWSSMLRHMVDSSSA